MILEIDVFLVASCWRRSTHCILVGVSRVFKFSRVLKKFQDSHSLSVRKTNAKYRHVFVFRALLVFKEFQEGKTGIVGHFLLN